MLTKCINDLRRGISLYRVWTHQAYHELSAKYKRTILGSFWVTGAMVSTSIALAIVMGGLMQQDLRIVLPYIMAGIICYGITGFILVDGPEIFNAAAFIIKNHAYPFTFYTFESVTRAFIMFLHNIVVYYIVVCILMVAAVPNWSILPALALVYVNSAVWGTLIGMLSARFRDLRFMLPFLSQIIFFMTPVFWRPEQMTGWRTVLYEYNPFYGLMEIVRAPLFGGVAPLAAWGLAAGSLVVGSILWLFFFSVFRSRIAFWV